jgi:hypothetical protein
LIPQSHNCIAVHSPDTAIYPLVKSKIKYHFLFTNAL